MGQKLTSSLIDLFERYQVFVAHAHTNPDPDSIGSLLALKLGLESLGKVVNIYCEDNLEDSDLFLPHYHDIQKDTLINALTVPHDAYVSLDTAAWKLATYHLPVPVFPKPVINIDHHQDNVIASQYSWVEPNATSTAEMVFTLLGKLNVVITPEIATCLLFGILGDTGIFQNINTNDKIFTIVNKLIKAGGDYRGCVTYIGWTLPFLELKAWGLLLDNLKLSEDGKYVWTTLGYDQWKQFGHNFSLSGFANTLVRKVEGTDFGAVMVEKRPGHTSGSLRSRLESIDVSQIAHRLNGGGHPTAPGFKIPKPIDQAEQEFLQVVKELEHSGKL